MNDTTKDTYIIKSITVSGHIRKLKNGKICNVSPYIRTQTIRKSRGVLIDLDSRKEDILNVGDKNS